MPDLLEAQRQYQQNEIDVLLMRFRARARLGRAVARQVAQGDSLEDIGKNLGKPLSRPAVTGRRTVTGSATTAKPNLAKRPAKHAFSPPNSHSSSAPASSLSVSRRTSPSFSSSSTDVWFPSMRVMAIPAGRSPGRTWR